jgi:hypothetical protein
MLAISQNPRVMRAMKGGQYQTIIGAIKRRVLKFMESEDRGASWCGLAQPIRVLANVAICITSKNLDEIMF